MTDKVLTVDEAVNAVAAEIDPIAKGLTSSDGQYTYRGIDQVMNALAPIQAKYGVTVVPHEVTAEHEWVESTGRNNKVRVERLTSVVYTFMVRGPAGDSYTGQIHAEAMNSRDKSAVSAASYAYRTFVSLLFRIPTAAPDPEENDDEARPMGQYEERPPSAVEAGWDSEEEMAEARAKLGEAIKAAKAGSEEDAYSELLGVMVKVGVMHTDDEGAHRLAARPSKAQVDKAMAAIAGLEFVNDPGGEPDKPEVPAEQLQALSDLIEFVGGLTDKPTVTRVQKYLKELKYWPVAKVPPQHAATALEIAKAAAAETDAEEAKT